MKQWHLNSMWVLYYMGIGIAALMTPLWFYALCAVAYALFRPGYELIVIGMLIDAQFGAASPGFPYVYTLLTAGIILVLAFLKPNLSFYTEGS